MRFFIIILAICFFTMGCEEIYPPNIDEQTPILVFEGELTNMDTIQTIKISKSLGFNDKSYFEKMSGFHVSIEDKNGDVISLIETNKGYYQTESNCKGEMNHEYRLVAYDTDGRLYVSTYQRLLPQAEITNLSGKYYSKTKLIKNRNSGYYDETEEGMEIQVTAPSSDSTAYYRYEYDAVFQTIQSYFNEQPFPKIYYVVQPTSSLNYGTLALANGHNYTDGIIWKFPIESFKRNYMESHVFISEVEYDSVADTLRYQVGEITINGCGMLLRVKQHSLSQDGFTFWNSFNKQLNASGTLFDPIESQIVGNMVCVDDSSEVVFGYFGASSVNIMERHFYFRWDNQVISQPIKYFPFLSESAYNNFGYDFWVDKY